MNSFLSRPDVASNPSVVTPDNVQSSISIALPSQGIFYASKNPAIEIVPTFTVAQVRGLYIARNISDEKLKKQSIATVIQKSLPSFSVYDLTIDDYTFIMYWIRLNTYESSPLIISWESELKNKVTSTVQMTTLDIIEVDRDAVPDILYRDLTYATLRDSIEVEDYANEDDKHFAKYAMFTKGENLKSKLVKLESMPADTLSQIKTYMRTYRHGVGEYCSLIDPSDPEAREHKVHLTIELSDFFP